MSALVLHRVNRQAGTLAKLKVRVRAALATELAGAVGAAVRDVLVVAIVDRITTTPRRSVTRAPSSHSGGWRDGGDGDRDRWGEPTGPWADPDDDYDTRDRTRARYAPESDDMEPVPAVPTMTAVAVGANVGRWWLARRGSVPTAIGFGVLATALGLTAAPSPALAVLAAATDLLTAESALARLDPS